MRTQLLVSFALVAVVALAAGGLAVVWLMQGYRTQVTMQRLRDAAGGAGFTASFLERQGLPPDTIATSVAAQVPLPAARVLVLDSSGLVVADQAVSDTAQPQPGLFTGRRLVVPAAPIAGARGGSPSDHAVVWQGSATLPGGNGYLLVAAPAPSPEHPPDRAGPAPGSPGQGIPDRGAFAPDGPNREPAATYHVVLAIPRQSLPSAWQELAPGLAVAAAIALLAAAGVAWWLAGSIARPIRAVTQATARITRGEPHQPIPEEGVEEVAALAQGFNTMVQEVERSQRTLREFVANASHELRTPLTAIQGFSQAVVDGVLEAPEPTQDAARLIQREAERMRRLVEDLLLLSKMEARDRAVRQGTVDLAELLDTLAQRTELVARDRGLRLALDVPERLLVRGDANQLEHLFGNLLDNAAKYSPDGATITVRAALDPGDARRGPRTAGPAASRDGTGSRAPRVVVTVHNTGSAIPPEDLPHIFERFYRVDKSRSRDVAGSGLGLAIAREVAERHGGTIRAESDPATGTAFVATLPAAGPAQEAVRAGAARVESRAADAGAAAGRPVSASPPAAG